MAITRCLALLVGLTGFPALAVETAGTILFSQGVTTSQRGSQPARLVGKGESVQEGDVLSTGTTSFAVMELKDGSRMTLRPGTVFAVEKLSQEPGKEQALMQLFKGGLRALTGLIGKRSPDAVMVRTPVATIGIRGTDFDARLCAKDCAQENAQLAGAATPRPEQQVAARVAVVQGDLSAAPAGGPVRRLVAGAPVYVGDVVQSGREGFAVLAFRDDTRFTLQANTRFALESYKLDAAGKDSNALFRLFKGGLRMVTGLIGKQRPEAFRLQTVTATIGIRGTGADIHCGGPCAPELPPQCIETPNSPRDCKEEPTPGDGLYVATWEGSIEVRTPVGGQVVGVNEVALAHSAQELPRLVARLPEAIQRSFTAPRPNEVPVDLQKLFGTEASNIENEGLYVWVRDGHVSVDREGQKVELGRGEAAFAGLAMPQPVRIEVPAVLRFDPIPPPATVSGQGNALPLFRSPDAGVSNECQM